MRREALGTITALCVTLTILLGCASDSQRSTPAHVDLSSLIDSVATTTARSGKFSLASTFFQELAELRRTEGADSARTILLDFFSRMHPDIRVSDSLAVQAALKQVEEKEP